MSTWTKEELRRERRLVTVATLTTAGNTEQPTYHLTTTEGRHLS